MNDYENGKGTGLIKFLLVLLIVGGAGVGILFGYDVIKVDTNNLPLRDTPEVESPVSRPRATLKPVVRPPSATTAVLIPTATPEPTAAAVVIPTSEPTPTLNPVQIFKLLDDGKITSDQAMAMLGRPTATPLTIPNLPGYDEPTATPNSPTPVAPTATPIPSSLPGSPAVDSQWVGDLENLVHQLINVKRQEEALARLAYDSKLADIGRTHSDDMITGDYFSHTNLLGQSPSDRADIANYSCIKQYDTYYTSGIGENLFQGWLFSSTTYVGGVPVRNYMSMDQLAEQIVEGWMNSPGHRENIVDPQYDKEGIGVVVGPKEQVLVTQNFC